MQLAKCQEHYSLHIVNVANIRLTEYARLMIESLTGFRLEPVSRVSIESSRHLVNVNTNSDKISDSTFPPVNYIAALLILKFIRVVGIPENLYLSLDHKTEQSCSWEAISYRYKFVK